MKVLRTKDSLGQFIAGLKADGRSIGLVPTMGALHAGHKSLVDRAVAENDAAVVSVFVNPVQFNNKQDLATYPRNEEADFQLLRNAGVAAVFAPEVSEMYPDGEPVGTDYNLGQVAEVMEGAFRPGHFQGVALIVDHLFSLVRPDRAYFGEKDFQQIAVVRRMASTVGHDIDIVACPIVREPDGLALSSRNVRLTPGQRAVAPGIYRALADSVAYSQTHSPADTARYVTDRINALPECEVEYYSIVDALSMQPVSDWSDAPDISGCITVYCGPVRLIDNIAYRKATKR